MAGLSRNGISSWTSKAVAALCLLIASYYIYTTTKAIWHLGWTEIFSDQFTQYSKLLQLPFPENALRPDNAHRQITSNLVRLADIHWGGGDQRIGVIAGLFMLLSALVMLVIYIWRDRTQGVLFRSACVLLATVALMWMGSARMQFHGNESFQVYLVMICAFTVIFCVERLRERPAFGVAFLAIFSAFVALLSFATGVAVFGLLFAMMVVRGVPVRWSLPTGLLGCAAILTYLYLLPGGEGVRGSLTFSPVAVGQNVMTWLASFWTTSWLSFANEGVAGVGADLMYASSGLGAALVVSAKGVFAATGSPTLLGLATIIGALGLLLLASLIWRAWRNPQAVTAIESLGLGLTIFALGVAVLVALGRKPLFDRYPGQLLADRYVLWTNLFWLGLALSLAVRIGQKRTGLITTVAVAVLISVMVHPTHRLWHGWASSVEREIERRAAEAQVGIYTSGIELHCAMKDIEGVRAAVAVFRDHQVGMFRAPRNRLMGHNLVLPAAKDVELINGLRMDPVIEVSAPSGSGWHTQGFLSDSALRRDIDGLVVANASGRVVGLGEFGYRFGSDLWQSIETVADGFDVYLRAEPPCSGLTLYGVDNSAKRFVPLAVLPECSLKPDQR